MKDLGGVFSAKRPARPRSEVGKKLVKFKEQKGSQCEQHLGRGDGDRGDVDIGRGQGKKLGL